MSRFELPKELPEKPTGWTKHMSMHMNFGSDGGAASYTIKDETGADTPIGYQYDTRALGLTGFSLPGVKGVMSWSQLRAKWAEWLEAQP